MLTPFQKNDVDTLVRQVGEHCIFPYFRNLREEDVSFKESEYDPVSVADKAAEQLLRDGLLAILPDSLFIGEESYAEDKSILDFLNQNDKPVWIVDPIDGTANFVAGREGFGIILCLVYQGIVHSSWFFEVCSGEMITYHTGDDAIHIRGSQLPASKQPEIPYKGQIGFKLFQFDDVQKLISAVDRLVIEQATDPSIINYRKMLTGELDFLVYKMTYPWDHLAGLNMVRFNGGTALRWNGEGVQLQDIDEGLIVARDKQVMDTVMEEIVTPLRTSKEVMGMTSFKV